MFIQSQKKIKPIQSTLIPTVIDKVPWWGERVYDIYSRLLEDRIIFLTDAIDSIVANTIIAQLLFLEKQDPKAPITLYINTPWWHVTAGLAIYDTMQHIQCDITVVCVWLAASMGSIILAWGTKGKRFSLPHSEIMIHQPLGWAEGQATDIKLAAEHIVKTWHTLYKILSHHTGQPIDKVEKDCDRDNFMTPQEALEYWLIDKIIKNK
jgi:ATP-dependent Clp protease protease subunit